MCTHNLFRFFSLLVLSALIFAPLTPAAPTRAQAPQPEAEKLEYVPDRLLARLQDGYSPSKSEAEALGVQSMQRLFSGHDLPAGLAQIVEITLSPGSDVHATQAALAKGPRFVWVEPDYLAHPIETQGVNITPNDPEFPAQWGLTKIGAPAAWDVQTGSEMVEIAIVDSGIDLTHADLQGRLWINPGEVPGNGLDDDNNQFIDDINGWDFVNEDNNPVDDNGHGTQVAGVAATSTDNELGIAGTCWSCKLMAVKVMSVGGVANYSDIALGVYYAADKGAEVINLSLGGYSFSNALLEAVQYAINDKGAVVVAGAGNDNTDSPFYPAAYTEAIAVAGTDSDDHKASFSDYGEWVDLSAPAVDIQTTFSGGDYGPVDGTSMAAPFVSGVAGLLRSEHSDWSSALVRLQMTHTADSLDALNPGYEGLLGSGRIDASSALTVAPHPLLSITEKLVDGDPLGRPTPGESATLEITLSNDWLDAFGVSGKLSTSDGYVTITQSNADFGSILAGGSGTGSPAYTFSVASAAPYDHPIDFKLQVSANGGAYSTSLNFTIKTRSAEEPVSGTIGADTTWANDKTYIVTGNVGVAPGYTLTIEPGTDVLFNGEYSLNVGGELIAEGTEEQPIRFLSNTGSPWGRIYFDDPSIDATADLEGNYLGGNILRWVVVEGAGQGIGCNNATPYLSHLTTDGGGVNCAMGLTPAWLLDSSLHGSTTFTYNPLVGAYDTPDMAMSIAVSGTYAYIADRVSGLRVIDVSDPVTPSEVGLYDTIEYAMGLTIRDGYVYLAAAGDGLRIIDVNDPAHPDEEGAYDTPGGALGVAVSGSHAYVADELFGLRVIDVSNLANPFEVGDYATTRAEGVVISGDYAYVADYEAGLRVIDVSDPASPVEVGNYDTPGYALDVAIMGGYAYLADNDNGLVILDVSDPTNPTEVSTFPTRLAYGVFGSENYVYLAEGVDGLRVIDVNDPTYPIEAIYYNTQVEAHDVVISSGYVYVADGIAGLGIFPAYRSMFVSVQNTTLQGGDVSLPSGSFALNSTINGSLILNGGGDIQDVNLTGGNITIGSGRVLSNTIMGGGILAGYDALVRGNNIEDSPSWGIQTSGAVTVQGNRLVGNAAGIQASGGSVQGNLVANSAGVGLEINGDVSVRDNTFIGNAGNTIVINSGAPTIQGNNLEGNTGEFDILSNVLSTIVEEITADGNWWGTTNDADINLRIFDFNNDYAYSKVVYLPVATGPIQTAPAYVRSVTLDPESPVGIETVKFTVEFSRPMDQAVMCNIIFRSLLYNTWSAYPQWSGYHMETVEVDGKGSPWVGSIGGGVARLDNDIWTVILSSGVIRDIQIDPNGSAWFVIENEGVMYFDGMTWTQYNTTNSGLPDNSVGDITLDLDGSHWFATPSGAARFDGVTWKVYTTSNSGLPANNVGTIFIDPDGTYWFGTQAGAAKFDVMTWTVYNTSNSGLPVDGVGGISGGGEGVHWFTTGAGVVKFDGTTWTVYNTSNSDLPFDLIYTIAGDQDGSQWFGFGTSGGGVVHFDGTNWTAYNIYNSGLLYNDVFDIAIGQDGSHWFTTNRIDMKSALGLLRLPPTYSIQDKKIWLDETHFQVSFDITSLIPLDDYRLTVESAVGTDGIQIVPNTATTFTVDYAGAVSDTTPPGLPIVTACAGTKTDHLSASWTASDPDSSITLYQYAIGTTPGGTQVVNWTSTSATSFELNGLTLTPGQLYYISVKARNAGGLWSGVATPDGLLPGSGTCTTNLYLAYLSLLNK